MIERASWGLTSSEIVDVDGVAGPAHTRVFFVSPTRSRISSSISTLSFSARMATQERPRLSLAVTSSATIEKTSGDHP